MQKKLHFLIIDDETEIADLLCLVLSQDFFATFSVVHSGFEAIELLKNKSNNFDLIFSDYKMEGGTGTDVLNFLIEEKYEIPFILATGDPLMSHKSVQKYLNSGYVKKPFDDSEIKLEVNRLLKLRSEDKAEVNYIGISINTLLKIKYISANLFVRLNDEKYVRFINAGSNFELNDLNKMKDKGIDLLYVERSNFSALTSEFKKRITNEMLFTLENVEFKEMLDLSSSFQEVIIGTINTLGLTLETQELTKKNIQLIQSIIERNESLKSTFEWSIDSRLSYVYQHSVLLSYLVCEVSRQYDFKVALSSELLTLASFLHDVKLTDYQAKNEDRFIKAHSLGLKSNLKDIELILTHPTSSFEAASKWCFCPEEVLEIIRCHHEKPDGTGFPRKLKANQISSMSACFIVCEELVKTYLEFKNWAKVRESWIQKKLLYSELPFKDFYDYFAKKLLDQGLIVN